MRSADVKHSGPVSSKLAYAVGRTYLTLAGWEVEGELPDVPKFVIIAAPHTSGWDLPYMISVAWVFRIQLSWLGKHTLFEGAKGSFMRWLGGIAVDRRKSNGVVGQIVDRFADTERLFLAIAPEGTRRRADLWKSGFYHMAKDANVPIVCGFLDFGRKVGGVGPAIVPTGDIAADMARLRAFYEGIEGRKPECVGDIRLAEESHKTSTDTATLTAQPA